MERRRLRMRLVLIGDFGVGKTSLMRQYLDRTFLEAPSNTLQEDERETTYTAPDSTICDVSLMDTAGQEQFRSFTSSFLRDKHGALAVYDVNNLASFRNLAHWIQEIRKWDEHTQIVVVGNKIDLSDRQVTIREAEEFTHSVGGEYVETSARLEINCIKAFETLMRRVHAHLRGNGDAKSDTPTSSGSSPVVTLGGPAGAGAAGAGPEQQNFTGCPCVLM